MPIVVAFTLTSLVAVILHYLVLRIRRQRRDAVLLVPDEVIAATGASRSVLFNTGQLLVNVELTRFALNMVLLIVGVGIILGFRLSGYLLAGLPLISITSSLIALRGPRRD